MSTVEAKDIELTPVTLAEHTGLSRPTAYRRMCDIMLKYPGIVERRGRILYGKLRLLSVHIPELRGETPVDKELRILRGKLAEMDRRLDAEASARLEFQRKASAWFERSRAKTANSAR